MHIRTLPCRLLLAAQCLQGPAQPQQQWSRSQRISKPPSAAPHACQCASICAASATGQPTSSHAGQYLPAPAQPPYVYVGIDPDTSGALAIVRLAEPVEALAALEGADVTVHDNPVERVQLGKRLSRQADAGAVAELVRGLVREGGLQNARVVLEAPQMNPLNGKHSYFGVGFSYGVWSAALLAHRVPLERVNCRRWKTDLGLNGRGKEGSRELAMHIFPSAAAYLRRKMDHGRAEAMLIAAWAMGVRLKAPAPTQDGAPEASKGLEAVAPAASVQPLDMAKLVRLDGFEAPYGKGELSTGPDVVFEEDPAASCLDAVTVA